MSISFDNLLTNVLEKALSQDENDTQTLIGRPIAEALRMLSGNPTVYGFQDTVIDMNMFLHDTKPCVWGLPAVTITSAPRVFNVGAGILVNNAGAESPTALDSDFRAGLNPATTAVTIPAADDLYHLLQCRVVNATVSDTRDILTDPNTDDTLPTSVVKQNLKRLTFQIITGTSTAIPTPTAGWTPLYAFFLSTGAPNGLPLVREIIDMRPAFTPIGPRTRNPDVSVWFTPNHAINRSLLTDDLSVDAFFHFEAMFNGRHLFANSLGRVPSTAFLATGASLGVDKFMYWYLTPLPAAFGGGVVGNWAGRVAGAPEVVSNCVVVVTDQPPGPDGRNLSTMTLTAPFGGTVVPAFGGLCVGVTLAGGVGGYVKQATSPAGVVRWDLGRFFSFGPNLPAISTTLSIAQASMPRNVARHFDWDWFMNVATATQVTPNSRIRINANPLASSILVNPKISGIIQSMRVPGLNSLGSPAEGEQWWDDSGGYSFAMTFRDEFNAAGVAAGNVVDVSAQLGLRLNGITM